MIVERTENHDKVFGLFAKWPKPGAVKTRLAAETSPEWAADVARAFLLDMLDCFASVRVRRILAFAPDSEESAFAEVVTGRFQLVPQVNGDLGARLADFFEQQFRAGAQQVVVIGSDSPSLPAEFIDEAFAKLDAADVVLGPATDGGYYLIGCARPLPGLFLGIPWSGPRVLLETMKRASQLDLRLALLEPWYDVDSLADWWMLQGHLAALHLAGQAVTLPHTEGIAPLHKPDT